MIHFLRVIFLGVPVAFVLLTFWAAGQVRASRALRAGDMVALMSQPTVPVVNPYQPKSEAERQLVEAIHAPLLRIGDDGRLAPVLASQWRWTKRVTVWFAEAASAMEARKRLLAVKGESWAVWKLESAQNDGRALRLSFSDPMLGEARAALQAAGAKVRRLLIWRVEAKGAARAAFTALQSKPLLAEPVQRVWIESADAFEMALVGLDDPVAYERDARRKMEMSLRLGVTISIRTMAELPMLEEPVLEFTLRDDVCWHDGSEVNAVDVKATFDALSLKGWALPNREGLRVVSSVDSVAAKRVEVVLWRHYGPALCAWVGLPILPAKWLETHAMDDAGLVFQRELPPGAGPCRIEHRDYSSMVIRPAEESASVRRLTMVTSLSAFSTQLGYSTSALDLFWPHAAKLPQLALRSEPLATRRSPPQQAVQVLWNLRREPLRSDAVREALSRAVDRPALVTSALHNAGMVQEGLFAPGLWLSHLDPAPAADSARAEQVLAGAGWLRNVRGFAANPGGELKFTLLVPDDAPALLRVAVELRLQWLKCGVQAQVKASPRKAIMALLHNGDYDGVVLDVPLLTTWDLWPQWHSDEPGNVTGFANRQVDLLLEALRHEFQPEEAALRAQKAEALIIAGHAVLPLATTLEETVMRESLSQGSDLAKPWSLTNLLVEKPGH